MREDWSCCAKVLKQVSELERPSKGQPEQGTRERRNEKELAKSHRVAQKRKVPDAIAVGAKRIRHQEKANGENEILKIALSSYCSVLRLDADE